MPTEKDIKNWYNKVYSDKGSDSMRPFEAYPIILDYLKADKSGKLLDVSCGTGNLLLAASNHGLETYGVDISEEAVKVASTKSPNSKIKVGQAENLEFEDKTFNYVTCLGSLEHFLDMPKSLQEMRRVARDDATFCIEVPNSNFIYWKISKDTGTQQQDINETLMTKNQWLELFTKNGFETIKTYQDKWFMKRIRVFQSPNPIKILKNLFLKTAWLFMPLNWTYQFIYILKKQN